MKADNHFVPKVYLRGWQSRPDRTWVYRVLVSAPSVPVWKEHWIRGVAKRHHLYTSVVAGEDSDRIESWLDRDFEAPAADPIRRVLSDQPLRRHDWRALINFVAAQDVRTPTRYIQHMETWSRKMPDLLQSTVRDAVARLEQAGQEGVSLNIEENSLPGLPVKVVKSIEPGADYGELRASIVLGRETWLFGIERLLSNTLRALHEHRWTVLRPARGKMWITSDNPVLKLNYDSPDKFTFGGGWGSKGTELMLPLGPQHLLYARVGHTPPPKGTVITSEWTDELRRLIAINAHRLVIAASADAGVATLRPRHVDAGLVRSEQAMWKEWHAHQSDAVRDPTNRVRAPC